MHKKTTLVEQKKVEPVIVAQQVVSKIEPEFVRVPLHSQNILVADYNKPGWKPKWVNESVGNVDAHFLAGWTMVLNPNMKTHDNLSQVESQMDSVVRRVVNKYADAPFRTAVLMEIPLSIYEEDHREEQRLNDEKERDIKKLKQHEYGEVSIGY